MDTLYIEQQRMPCVAECRKGNCPGNVQRICLYRGSVRLPLKAVCVAHCGALVCFADSVHSVEHISERAVDLRMSSMSPETSVQSPRAAGGAGIIRPIAVKLPLHAVSDRMNVDAGIELPSLPPLQRPSKTSAGTGAPGVDRFPLSVKENMTREMAEERWYDGEANSNSDDEVCDVFSRARRFQAAAAVSSWLSCDIVDGRRCVRLLRALAARGAGMARSSRWTGLPQRWLHDSRTAAVVNAVELPRPFLDFTKMQVSQALLPTPTYYRPAVQFFWRDTYEFVRLSVGLSVCRSVSQKWSHLLKKSPQYFNSGAGMLAWKIFVTLSYAKAHSSASVCPSVCLSVTRWY